MAEYLYFRRGVTDPDDRPRPIDAAVDIAAPEVLN
jgi:hypothetical protein